MTSHPRSGPEPEALASRARAGEERALARLLTGLEDGAAWAAAALRLLRTDPFCLDPGEPRRGPSQVIGVTGPPGTGKSTLVDRLAEAYRGRGERVGILAVDPSSPFSGGAILGDRIRMRGLPDGRADPGLFFRSLASRGRLGGLSRASAQCARALEAAGYGVVLVETVGIGQSEVDIARLADTVVLVSMPGSGDDIQTIKAGVMEIGDVFVVNKADREGADRAVREIRAALELGAGLRAPASSGRVQPPLEAEGGLPPVLKTVAQTGEGLEALLEALDGRWKGLGAAGGLEARRRRGAMAEARALLGERVLEELEALEGELEEGLAADIVKGRLEAAEAAELLFKALKEAGDEGAEAGSRGHSGGEPR